MILEYTSFPQDLAQARIVGSVGRMVGTTARTGCCTTGIGAASRALRISGCTSSSDRAEHRASSSRNRCMAAETEVKAAVLDRSAERVTVKGNDQGL